MYLEFYNLHSFPFDSNVGPSGFFASEQHQEALAAIEYSIRHRQGAVLITGDVGTGTSMIGQMIADRCGDRAKVLHLLPGYHSSESLLRHILRTFDVSVGRREDNAQMLERLRDHLADHLEEDQRVVLLADESQTLSDEALDALRWITDLECSTRRSIQVVLLGKPELRQRLRRPRHQALRQRITLAKRLWPLDLEDTGRYITHRLQLSSVDQDDIRAGFAAGAIREIHRITQGIPRLINGLGDHCLLLGLVRQEHTVSAEMVHQVAQDMLPDLDEAAAAPSDEQPSLALAGNF